MGFLRDKSESGNKNFPWLNDKKIQAETIFDDANAANNEIFGMLQGVDGGRGFANYKNSVGFRDVMDEAMRGVSGNNAARGLMASGSTIRGMQDRAGQISQQGFANYINQISQANQARMNSGLGLMELITGGGQFGKSTQGLGSALGGIAQGIGTAAAGGAFSDPRLKTDINLLGREPDGLGVYEYRYKWDDPSEPLRVGVMADEVAEIRPWALGPVIEGFGTVYYGKL